ncbi:hypothetical protein BXZ70DRAFT_1013538 [Cristinia sonorae]|uniref:Zn(2)-C6 fungal-type domain-containing protein n=1 Tax=Cristinia sonorae TaxID=1940300 RepID=A0A8K0UYZ1_9AGAR|nr:hypothetical protein BXZ70DRAFT_1013538 [Cristinia sonorae]
MVAAPTGDLYFPRGPVTEEGFQSSEEGSDLHSPIFEDPYPPVVRYHLGHQISLPDVHASSLVPPYDARYPIHDINVQIPDQHLIGPLQVPSPPSLHIHQQPHPPHSDYGLHHHGLLDLTPHQSGRHDLSTLSPPDNFSYNLPQTRLPEPQLNLSHEPPHPTSTRRTQSIAPIDTKQRIVPATSAKGAAPSPSSNAAPTRPPRREASTAVIACRQCRARKIRCDSTRPVCNNCTRRNNECEYDAVPKRRGPDKRPGTRQRSCKKRPPESDHGAAQAKKRRKMGSDHEGSLISFDVKENVTGNGTKRPLPTPRFVQDDTSSAQIPQSVPLLLETSLPHRHFPPEAIYPKDEVSTLSQRCPLVYNTMDPALNHADYAHAITIHHQPVDQETRGLLPGVPSTQHSRSIWWGNLLHALSDNDDHEQALNFLRQELEFLLTFSSYWLFFFNKEALFRTLSDPHERLTIQPALIMASLALASLMKSSQIELGSAGRNRALFWRNSAQAALEVACKVEEIDYTLAEAALILAVFESSAHPEHSTQRTNDALTLMDRIIVNLSLQLGDITDPDATNFEENAVPSVIIDHYTTPKRCCCFNVPLPQEFSFAYNPPWDPHWNADEMRKEECRRICWSALTLIATHTAQCAAFHQEPLALQLADPSKFALLFPGEAYERAASHQIPGQSPKESIWALYCRSMLLWNSCIRQQDLGWSTQERATFAIEAWAETQAVQDALDMHICNSDTALMYVCREFLYNTRMTITSELRRLADVESAGAPRMFSRRHAQEWLYYQDQVAKRVKESVMRLGDTPGHLLSRRPFQVSWFSSQVAICLALWNYDRGLMQALELAKTFLIPLDALCILWPCEGQRARRDELRLQLEDACNAAGIQCPLHAEVSMPPILRRLL